MLTVLSLFDGMSCGQIALKKAGYERDDYVYYASEIHKPSITVTQHNFPNTIQTGDVTKVSYKGGILSTENGDFNVGKIDLLIGGSPCQSISNLGKKEGLDGKSGLFYHYLRLLKEVNPDKWLLENVCGSKKAIEEMNSLLGTTPTMINSNLVSAQNRKRLYWTNKEQITLPDDKGLWLVDILDEDVQSEALLSPGRLRWLLSEKGQASVSKRYTTIDPIKASCLTARSDKSWNCNYVTTEGGIRKLSINEYEKLQTVPLNYVRGTQGTKTSDMYEMLGNGWTVDVIVHIFKQILND